MESDSRRPKNPTSFSERVAAFVTHRISLHFPSQEDVVLEENADAPLKFLNELPPEESEVRRSFIRWQYHKPGGEDALEPEILHNENLAEAIILPATVICVPIALLASVLLALVYM
jgi:hypothetical protein